MTTTIKLTAVSTLVSALVMGLGVHMAFAQEEFEAPRGDRPAPLRALIKAPAEIRAGVQADIQASQDARAELRANLEEKKDAFRNRQIDVRADVRTQGVDVRADLRADANAHQAEIKAQLDAAETEEERKAILDTARAQREEMRAAALQKRDEFRVRADSVRAELKENRAEFRAEVKTEFGTSIKVHLENILKRASNAIDTFVGILERVNNKIAELEANGADTTAAAQASVEAEASIDAAALSLAQARAAFTVALESETPREHFEEVKTAVRATTQAVKEAHRMLKLAIVELKELIRSINVDISVDAEASIQ